MGVAHRAEPLAFCATDVSTTPFFTGRGASYSRFTHNLCDSQRAARHCGNITAGDCAALHERVCDVHVVCRQSRLMSGVPMARLQSPIPNQEQWDNGP